MIDVSDRVLPLDRIEIGSFAEAAREARGIVVVIDVFRAFTTAAVALSNGASRIAMVDSLEAALDLRATGVASACLGERGGVRPEGFDYGNSPVEIEAVRFDGATLAQTTSNGTRGILAARQAERIYAGSLVTAEATAQAILAGPDLPVTLVAMGSYGNVRADEDEVCALYLRSLLLGRRADTEALARLIETMSLRRDSTILTPADIAYCLRANAVPFALAVTEEDGLQVARAQAMPTADS